MARKIGIVTKPAIVAMLFLLACAREAIPPMRPPESAAPVRVPKHPTSQAVEVTRDVYVEKLRAGTGRAIGEIDEKEGLLTIDAFAAGGGVVASVEELAWSRRAAWWEAALRDARVGDRRRIWFCGADAKKEWGDLAKQDCVAVDVELTTYSSSAVR